MTQEEFDRLPMLLRRHAVLQLLGINRNSLNELRASDPLLVVVLPGGREVRYRKSRLAKLVRLTL